MSTKTLDSLCTIQEIITHPSKWTFANVNKLLHMMHKSFDVIYSVNFHLFMWLSSIELCVVGF